MTYKQMETRKHGLWAQASTARARYQQLTSRTQRAPLIAEYERLNAEALALHDKQSAMRNKLIAGSSFKPRSTVAATAQVRGLEDALLGKPSSPYGGKVSQTAYVAGYGRGQWFLRDDA